jgi:predicted nuclease of predicted toxin-antitoxin system
MKLLLDESIPRRLAQDFPDTFDVLTVVQMGWAGTANGALLRLAAEHAFDALITADQSIAYQQNPSTLPIRVVVLVAARTRVQELRPLVPRVIEVLRQEVAIGVYRVAV